MASGQITITGTITTGNGTQNLNLPAITLAAPLSPVTSQNMASGDNTFAVPTGCTVIIIVFPTGGTNAKKVKGAGGDTGFALNPAGVNLLMPTGTPNLIINSSALDGSPTTIYFY